MRSPGDDRTSRAVIRDEALRLFAERGADAVTVRDIAAAAGVSPALVLRHYASKDGLRAAVDEHVVRVFEAVLAQAPDPADPSGPRTLPSLAEQVTRHLPPDSPIPAYLARLLITGGPDGTALFTRLHALAQDMLAGLVAAGAAADGGDLPVRAAFLLANDLAVLVLRDRLREVLGVDPLSADGLRRWGQQVLTVYGGGLRAASFDNPSS